MASVLMMGLLAGRRRPDRHPFLLGFTTFGGAALAVYVIQAVYFGDSTVGPYVGRFLEPLARIVGYKSVAWIPIAYPIAVMLLTWPQITFAMLGGWLSKRYRASITITPR